MKLYFRFAVLAIVFFSLATSSSAKDFKSVGVKKCKMCHKSKKIGNQFGIWSAKKHANAMKSLSSKESMDYAKKNGIADPTTDAKCTVCHSTMASVDKAMLDAKSKMTMEEGVSCESCHGPGSVYKKNSIMKDREKALAAGMVIPDEKTCVKCHNEKNPFHKPFDFKKMVAKIAHPVPKK